MLTRIICNCTPVVAAPDIDPQVHTRLRDEAIRRNVSITALALEWLRPFFDRLPPAEHEREEKREAE